MPQASLLTVAGLALLIALSGWLAWLQYSARVAAVRGEVVRGDESIEAVASRATVSSTYCAEKPSMKAKLKTAVSNALRQFLYKRDVYTISRDLKNGRLQVVVLT